MSAPLDNLGVNNYFPTRVRAARNGEESTNRMPGCSGVVETDPRPPLTDMGWEMSPESHRLILEWSARESGLPIYITENGSAWPDTVSEDGEVHDPERGVLPPRASRSRGRRHRERGRHPWLLRVVTPRQLLSGHTATRSASASCTSTTTPWSAP